MLHVSITNCWSLDVVMVLGLMTAWQIWSEYLEGMMCFGYLGWWIMKWGLLLLWPLHIITFKPPFLTIYTDGITTPFGFNRSRSYLQFHIIKPSLHVVTYLITSTSWISLGNNLGKKRWNTISIDTWPVCIHVEFYVACLNIIPLLHVCSVVNADSLGVSIVILENK